MVDRKRCKGFFVLLASVLSLFTISSVSANLVENITMNISELPKEGNFSYNFSLRDNETIFFSLIQNDSRTKLDFPGQISLNGTNHTPWEVFYDVKYFADYTGNYTKLQDIIGITNSYNSNLVLMEINYFILHQQEEKEKSYLNVQKDGTQVNIRTYTVVEFNRTHEVILHAPENRIVNISCGKFISCPNGINVSGNGKGVFKGEIYIPKDYETGTYDSFIEMTLDNRTSRINFTIEVEYRDDIYDILNYDIWDSSCYDSPEKLAECYKNQARYDEELANALLKRLEQKNKTCDCEPEIINRTKTKYVEVGDVDPELLKENRELRKENSELMNNITRLNNKLASCLDEKTKVREEKNDEIQALTNEVVLKKENLKEEYDNKKQEVENNMKSIYSSFVFYSALILTLALLVATYMVRNWLISSFPFMPMLIVTGIFWIGWIIMKVML